MAPLSLLIPAMRAAVRAGGAILEVYHTDMEVEYKTDRSPLTLADMRSHAIIVQELKTTTIPILSEEGKTIPHSQRRNWRQLWIVDPLDGTKEFIKRLGEFTVNIAFVESQLPTMGVIFVPLKGLLYFAALGHGAFRLEDPAAIGMVAGADENDDAMILLDRLERQSRRLPEDTARHTPFVIIGSRSHATPELHAFVESKRREMAEVEFISAGSSLKYCLVAEGHADVYPRLGPTMEWDTAAGQVIAEAAGAAVLCYDTGTPLVYNKEDLLNPWHIVTRRPVSDTEHRASEQE